MTHQQKLNHLISIMNSDEFDVLFDETTGIDNVGGEEKYRNLVNEYIDGLCSFGDVDAYEHAYDDVIGVKVMVEDFALYCYECG